MIKSFNAFLNLDERQFKQISKGHVIHPSAYDDYQKLREKFADEGNELQVISSYRPFERQIIIWNEKATGKRTLLDDSGNILDYKDLSEHEILFSILRWSALPGLSRHHFGTDLDIYDEKSRPTDYQIKLVPSEYQNGGIFQGLSEKLEGWILQEESFGFYRPYDIDRGKTAPEPWHISHKPTIEKCLNEFSFEKFLSMLESEIYQDLELIDLVKKEAKTVFSYLK